MCGGKLATAADACLGLRSVRAAALVRARPDPRRVPRTRRQGRLTPPPAPTARVRPRSRVDLGGPPVYPKIELHVHLEATVRPETLLEVARRNDYPLPANTVEGLAELYCYRDYIEGIFTPAERVRRGVNWQEAFEGVCDGAQEARERHGV